ncbi:MAG: hypothetical protein FVQ79_09970 [Planctomycetes bacterium]|nr:hypothetical protein [Planctomycetota bacterium]
MAIEAPFSKFKKNNFKIYITFCIVVAAIFAYDGYLSKYEWSKRQDFYKEHVIDNNGIPDSTMAFNRNISPALIVMAILFGIRLSMVKNRKLIADENNIITEKLEIPYDKIEQINKTNFDSKGYFVLTYKDAQGNDQTLKLSDRTYDNLPAVLDEIVKQIT